MIDTVFEKIIIENDIDQLPPPFCYRYKIEILIKPAIEVSFQVNYYDREGISTEEIEAEGFSESDNFEWKGRLPGLWTEPIHEAIAGVVEGLSGESLKIRLIKNGNSRGYHPKNPQKFEYFVQEIIQAIYEISGRQNEFAFQLIHKERKLITRLDFIFCFYQRNASVNKNEIKWNETEQLMNEIFSLEFDSFNASKKEPKNDGYFISPGDGLWYKADISVKSADKRSVQPILKKVFNKFGN